MGCFTFVVRSQWTDPLELEQFHRALFIRQLSAFWLDFSFPNVTTAVPGPHPFSFSYNSWGVQFCPSSRVLRGDETKEEPHWLLISHVIG